MALSSINPPLHSGCSCKESLNPRDVLGDNIYLRAKETLVEFSSLPNTESPSALLLRLQPSPHPYLHISSCSVQTVPFGLHKDWQSENGGAYVFKIQNSLWMGHSASLKILLWKQGCVSSFSPLSVKPAMA